MIDETYIWFAYYPILTKDYNIVWLKNVKVIDKTYTREYSFSLFDNVYSILISYTESTYYKINKNKK